MAQPDTVLKAKASFDRTLRNPIERHIGDDMIVGIEPAHVGMGTGEDELTNG